MAEEAEETLSGLMQSVSEHALMGVVQEMLDGAATGTISGNSIAEAAREAGVEVGEMAAKVEAVYAGMADAVADRLTIPDHQREAFQRWAAGRKADADRAVHQVLRGDATGFDKLGQQWREQLDMIDPEGVSKALTAAQIAHKRGPGGQLLVDVKGLPEMTFRSAVRMGLFRFSLA